MGCASSASTGTGLTPSPQTPGSVQQYGRETNVRVATDRDVVSAELETTPTDAWKALLKVYGDIGVPVTEQDIDRGTLGNPQFMMRRRFLGQRISRFLSCGDDMMGPIADRAAIEMSLRSAVVTEKDGKVRVDVLVNAVASPIEGTSTTGGPCHSTRRLEQDILNRVQLQLVGTELREMR